MEDNFWTDPDDIFSANNDTDGKADVPTQGSTQIIRKFNMGNDKDQKEYWQLLKIKALVNNPEAIAKELPSKHKESNILRDSDGNFSGLVQSVMKGIHATEKNQVELLRALREGVHKRHGIKDL